MQRFTNEFSRGTASPAKIISQWPHVHGLVQERRNPIGNAVELRLSSTNPLMHDHKVIIHGKPYIILYI